MEITFEQLPKAVTQIQCELVSIKRLLLDKANGQAQPATDQLLTISQVAEFLSLSVATVYGLVSRSEIPCMKKGKRLYFSKDEISDWIKTGKKKTISELSAETDTYLLGQKKGGKI
jgi:excisionase family DNA binding protein